MSAAATPGARPAERDDIQGLVGFAYKHLPESSFLLLRVRDPAAARAWLAGVEVADARPADQCPDRALQVALSAEGMRALGVAEAVVQGFSLEFVAGLTGDANRSARLGDVGESDPARWAWGTGNTAPHVLVLLYARRGLLAAWQKSVLAACRVGFSLVATLPTADMNQREPFGFIDGVSQPELDWERRLPARDVEEHAYRNRTCLGEFLLGYPNEYGLYTERPLLDPIGAAAGLPRAEDASDKADLGRNGSYLVLRTLKQDVAGLWRYLDQQASGDPELRRRWAEAMVGRTLDGKPLVDPDGDPQRFDYRGDPKGLRCPFGAHIRRANPRNADLPAGKPGFFGWLCRTLGFDAAAREQDRVASTRFHRLLRRGRDYGRGQADEQGRIVAGGKGETGLQFICLNANLGRQFEFVQAAWMNGARFDGLDREADPLLGDRVPGLDGQPTDRYSLPQADGPDQHLTGLPRFVTVRGGAYFFLPGIRALRYLATA